jgi:hypothetical protein
MQYVLHRWQCSPDLTIIKPEIEQKMLAKNDCLLDDFHIEEGRRKLLILRMVGGQGLEPRTSCV